MVTIAIASINTRPFTELAIRSAARRAGCEATLIVGDGGSTDGTLDMLDHLHPKLVDRVEVEPGGRTHGGWLDHWVQTVDDEWLAFVESDVVLLRDGWLTRLLDQQVRDDAAIVCGEWCEEWPNFPTVQGYPVHVMPRPSPWIQLVHRPTIQSLGTSYEWRGEDTTDVPEGVRAWDVGAWVAEQAKRSGHTVSVMPPDYQAYYQHYRGRSRERRVGKRARLQQVEARARLTRLRLLGR